MVDAGFNSRVAERITGLSYRQLVHWDETKLIRPSVRQASGRGTRRVYSFEDLLELRVVATLRQRGVSLQSVRKTVAYLRRHHPELRRPLANLTFVTDGASIFALTDDPGRVIDLTARGEVVIAMAVRPMIENLEAKVAAMAAPLEVQVPVRGKRYRAVLHPDLGAGGYWIEVPELPGCLTEADSVAEARAMLREVIGLWLDAEADRAASIAK
ncbi:MAG: MerR family transcriptional regulator [Myxococcales bacterium]|nr:MerR family transcriptional regulator [Myxococcales bacterium]